MTLSDPAMSRRAATLTLLALVGVVAVPACGPEDAAVTPSECAAGGPFTESACGRVLSAICQRYGTQASCDEAPGWEIDQGFPLRCAWADVATIADPTTCAVASSGGRCVAVVYVGEIACSDPCEDPAGSFPLITADLDRGELMRLPCDPHGGGGWAGPIDETTVTSTAAEESAHRVCAENVSPSEPVLCACAPQACATWR